MSLSSRGVEQGVHIFAWGRTRCPYIHVEWNWVSIISRRVELGVNSITWSGTGCPYYHVE